MKNTLAIIGVIAVAIFAGASILLTGLQQAANAQIPSTANVVGQTVNNNGFSSNQGYMQSCTQQSCTTNPIVGNGPFTFGLAQQTNKP
jgi:hypothetical protein